MYPRRSPEIRTECIFSPFILPLQPSLVPSLSSPPLPSLHLSPRTIDPPHHIFIRALADWNVGKKRLGDVESGVERWRYSLPLLSVYLSHVGDFLGIGKELYTPISPPSPSFFFSLPLLCSLAQRRQKGRDSVNRHFRMDSRGQKRGLNNAWYCSVLLCALCEAAQWGYLAF